MLRKVLVAFLLATMLALPVAAQDGKTYSADRFDVDVTVQNGGSLNVSEQVDFRFAGDPFSYVFRELPVDHTDGITNITAGVNGVTWPIGDDPGQVEIEYDNPIRIIWHLPPTTDTTQTFELSYEALGVARQEQDADVLDWQALPEDYDYTIASSQVIFTYPSTAELQGTPTLLDGDGIILTQSENSVRVSSVNLGPDEPLVARLNFVPGSLVFTPPAWQVQQQQADSLWWVWAGLASIIILGGGFALVRAVHPYGREAVRSDRVSLVPPSNLSPALVGIISGMDTSIGWQHALATLYDFAGRGYLQIEEVDGRKWYTGKDFMVTVNSWPERLLPHEQALFDLLFGPKPNAAQLSITGSEMSKMVSSRRWNEYKETVENELVATDLISPKRQEAASRFTATGLVLLLITAALFLAAFLLRDWFGYWSLLLAGATLLVAVMAFIASANVSRRSNHGEQIAASWEAFRRYIEQASKGKEAIPNPELFERYLPFAVAFGVAEGWAKQNEKSGWHAAPSYFHSLNMDNGAQSAAFIAVIAASNSSGGTANAAAAGAAAGAAGGGASGAG